MSTAIRKRRMTRDQFFAWAEVQDARYEFDSFEPVAMAGGTANHNRIARNLRFALRTRLRGKGCEPFGPDEGVALRGGEMLRLPEIGIEIPVSEFYEDVDLPAPGTPESAAGEEQ